MPVHHGSVLIGPALAAKSGQLPSHLPHATGLPKLRFANVHVSQAIGAERAIPRIPAPLLGSTAGRSPSTGPARVPSKTRRVTCSLHLCWPALIAAPIGTAGLLVQSRRRAATAGAWPAVRRFTLAIGGTTITAAELFDFSLLQEIYKENPSLI